MCADKVDAQLIDLKVEFAQRALEVITGSDVLKAIPVVKLAVVAIQAALSVRDEILLKKLETCLTALADVPAEDRRLMLTDIEASPRYRRRVGEHIVELLDRMDSHRKPATVGEVQDGP